MSEPVDERRIGVVADDCERLVFSGAPDHWSPGETSSPSPVSRSGIRPWFSNAGEVRLRSRMFNFCASLEAVPARLEGKSVLWSGGGARDGHRRPLPGLLAERQLHREQGASARRLRGLDAPTV